MTDREMEMHDSLDNAIRRAIEMRAEIERLVPIANAAMALRDKLKAIHDDAAYQSVWVVNQLHTGPYRGPTYTDELAALDAALDAIPSANRLVDTSHAR